MAGANKTGAPTSPPKAPAGATKQESVADALEREKSALESALRLLKLPGKTALDIVADKTNYGPILPLIEGAMAEKGLKPGSPEWTEELKSPQYRQKIVARLQKRLKAVEDEMAPPILDSVELKGNLCPATVREFGLVIVPDCKGVELDFNLRAGNHYLQLGYRYDQFPKNPTGQDSITVHRHSAVLGTFERYELLFGVKRAHGVRLMPTVTRSDSSLEKSKVSLDVGTDDKLIIPLPFSPVSAMTFSVGQSVGVLGDDSPYELTTNIGLLFPEDRPSYQEEQLHAAKQTVKDLKGKFEDIEDLDSPERMETWDKKVAKHKGEKTAIEEAMEFLKDAKNTPLKILEDESGKFTLMTQHIDEVFLVRGFEEGADETDAGMAELESAAFRRALVNRLQERLQKIDADIPPDPREEKMAKIAELGKKIEFAEDEYKALEERINASRGAGNGAFFVGRSMVSYELSQRSRDLYRLGGQANSGTVPLPLQLDIFDMVWNRLPATIAYQNMMGELPRQHALWMGLSSIAAGGLLTWGGIEKDDSAIYGQGNTLLANGLASLPQTWKGGRKSVFQRAAFGTLVVAANTAVASILIKNKDTRAFGYQMPGQTAGILFTVGSDAIKALSDSSDE